MPGGAAREAGLAGLRKWRASVRRKGTVPDGRGRFGPFGGKFVPETLTAALEELTGAYEEALRQDSFADEFERLLVSYAGRPTPLTEARRLSQTLLTGFASAHSGPRNIRIFLKREDLAHTGAHKINNTLGQGLLAVRTGRSRFLAETGAGQHGVATATVAALLGLECTVYMGTQDMARQAMNVERMRLLGAEVRPVPAGTGTLKDAMNEAIRDWVTNVRSTHYCIGSVAGPHPYPAMVRDFQRVIGLEARSQILRAAGRLPDALVACVGGGSNAIGTFYAFLREEIEASGDSELEGARPPALFGVEAAGLGLSSGKHAAALLAGSPGVLHGSYSYVLQDEHGQIKTAHSISAGLDYPGVGPEHSYLKETGRARYLSSTDEEAVEAFRMLARTEGILPALEPAHAIAALKEVIAQLMTSSREAPDDGAIVLLCLSGRGDKDLESVRGYLKERPGALSRSV